ncbi:MAG: DNA recombination protein RmuC [Microbacteriaceae bacterium]
MEIIYLVVGLLAGGAIGWLVARARSTQSTTDATAVAALSATNQAQLIQIDDLKTQLESIRAAETARLAGESQILERLAPVHTLLNQVEGRVREMENERKTQFQSISDQLTQAKTDGEALRAVTQGLKSALSDPNIRGHWGETQLERLFEAAGLIKGTDYITQDQIAGSEGEKGSRPDAVVQLPEGGQIIVDAKVTLTNYIRATEETDPRQREALLKQHAKDVAAKVKELSEKKYWQKYDLSADYVIMFMPTEAALAEALQVDPSIYDSALKQNVAIATPISLFTTLKSVALLWRQHRETNEIHEVISRTRQLIAAIARTATEVNDFAKSLNATVNNYNTFASWFENSLIGAAAAVPGVSEDEFPELTVIAKKPREIKSAKVDKLGITAADLAELDAESTMDTDGDDDSK